MKAVIIQRPRHASYVDTDRPRAGEGQVLARVASVGICMSDVELLEGTRPDAYVTYPVQPGHEWCGTVAELGAGVSGLRVGQRVAVEGHNFCRTCFWCRRGETNLCETYAEFGFTLPGGYAEFVAVRADLAHPFADLVPFDVAALTEPAACAGHGVLRAQIQPGDTVVVIGPGTIGLLALAWARLFTPRHLVVVGRSAKNETIARAMGATAYVASPNDAAALVRQLTGGRGADVVFEATGNRASIPVAIDVTRRGGTLVLEGIGGATAVEPMDTDAFCLKNLHVHGIFAYASRHFVHALRLIENGLLDVSPLITHKFPLAEYQRAFDLLKNQNESVVKVLLNP
jgi:2-desacetyl-2-hydroxyethyl bacteriochlorophyllide A dehydrogenase